MLKKIFFFSFTFEKKRRGRRKEGGGEGAGERESKVWQLLDSRACPQGPARLLGHVPVRQGSTCFTSFFIIQNKY